METGSVYCMATIINARGLAKRTCDKRLHRGRKILHQRQECDSANVNIMSVAICFAMILTGADFFVTMQLLSKFFDLVFHILTYLGTNCAIVVLFKLA